MTSFFIVFIICYNLSPINGLNIGVKRTKCSIKEKTYYNPCDKLYGAVCDGEYCICPPGTFEERTLSRCIQGKTSSNFFQPMRETDFDDLPYDYIPSITHGVKNYPTDKISYTHRSNDTIINRPYYPKQPDYLPRPTYPHTPGNPRQPLWLGKPYVYPGSKSFGLNNSGTYKPILFPDNPYYRRNVSSGRNINYSMTDQPYQYTTHAGSSPYSFGPFPTQHGYNHDRTGFPESDIVTTPGNFQNKNGSYGHRPHGTRYGKKSGGWFGFLFIIMLAVSLYCYCRSPRGTNTRNGFLELFGKTARNHQGVVYERSQVQIEPINQQFYVPQQPFPLTNVLLQPGQVNPPPRQQPVIGFVDPPPPYLPEYEATAPPRTS